MGFLLFLIIAAVIGFGIYGAWRHQRRLQESWSRAANRLGVTKRGGWGRTSLEGSMGGLAVAVSVYSTGGKNSQWWTRYRATFPAPGTAVHLKRQTGLSRVTKFFGAVDVEIGDTAFDDAFIIKADSERQAAVYLTLPRRSLLLRLYSLYRDVTLTPDYFEIVTRGYEDNTDRLVTNTRRLVSAARVLAGIGSGEDRIASAMRQRAAGDMAAAATALKRASVDPDDDIEEPLLEAGMLADGGHLEEAKPLLETLSARLPADEEVAGLQRAVGRMQPETSAPDKRSVDMREMLDDLFVSNRLSFETTEIFDEHYLGRNVTWSGKLKSKRDYERDLDFGSGPGTKLVVAIAEVEHDLYGVSEVDAVVSVPRGSAGHLERNALVTFDGKLLKADSMMRNVFVKDASLR